MLVNLYAKPYSKETAAKDLGVPFERHGVYRGQVF